MPHSPPQGRAGRWLVLAIVLTGTVSALAALKFRVFQPRSSPPATAPAGD